MGGAGADLAIGRPAGGWHLAGLRRRRPVSGLTAGVEALPHGHRNEDRQQTPAVDEVAESEAAGLVDQSEQPLEAGAPHPAGCPGAPTGDQIEGAANADGDRDGKSVPIPGDPLVLLGMPEGDQENVGTALLDTSDDVVVVHVVERRPRRFVHPGHHQSRVRGGEALGGDGRVAVLTAEEEDAGVDGRR